MLTKTEISVLKKTPDSVPIQKSLNESEYRKEFEELSRIMGRKWDFRNELSKNFFELPLFRPMLILLFIFSSTVPYIIMNVAHF